MTQEEKAKAYDEALERAKKINCDGAYANQRTVIGMIFPELAESEDERIRKAIILGIKRCADAGSIFGTVIYNEGVNYHDVLAYLEKQKEPHYTKRNALFDKCVENCDPKTVEEVNKRVDDIMNMPELSAFEQALTNFIGYWEDDEERWPSQFVKKHGKHILDIARGELQKEQKPVDLQVKGDGVYKICPRCKERMVRDDSKVYTSMPPQYGYECPKCGEIEFDTVMYDNPEMEEQKPTNELEDAFKYYTDRGITISCGDFKAEPIEQKPVEWSEEDEKMLDSYADEVTDWCGKFNPEYKDMIRATAYHFYCFRPGWRPSEEQMNLLLNIEGDLRAFQYNDKAKALAELYEQLKRM